LEQTVVMSRLIPAIVVITLLCGTFPAWAQTSGQANAQPRIADRAIGEEDEIRKRHEWFFSTRRAGAASDEQLAALRLAGVEQTRRALERQRSRLAAGEGRGQSFWVSKGPSPSTFSDWAIGNVSGRIPSIAADWTSGTLYVGSASGGLWKSTNDGLSWTSVFDTAGTMTIGSVAVDPNDPNVIWAGTGENTQGCESYFGIGLLRSPDGGATWEPRNGSGGMTLDQMASFANVIVDPRDSNRIVTGGRLRGCEDGDASAGGIFTTEDGGLTWTERLSDRQINEIARDPEVLDILWAGTNNGVYKSYDNGENWQLQTNSGLPTGNVQRTEIAIAPSDPGTVYALFSGPREFWKTSDGGASWTQMATGSNACDGQCWYNMVIRVHRTNRNIVYRGTVHIFKSLDAGATWTDLSNNWGPSQKVHQDTHHFLMHPTDPDTFYVGCDGGIWKTADGGDSFTNLNGNLNLAQFYAVGVQASDPDTICGGAQDNSSLVRTTSDVWDLQAVTGDGFVCHFDSQDPNYAYITSYPFGGYPNVWRSTSGVFGGWGAITREGSGIAAGDRSNWVTPYLLDPIDPAILYIGTHRVYRSENHGDSWVQVGPEDMTGGSGSLLSLAINRNFPEVLYAGSGSGKLWRTVNSGTHWTEITAGLPSRSINDVASDPTDPDRAFAVVSGFNTPHLWEWTATEGWTSRGADLPNVPANSVLMLTGADLLVGMDTGIFRSYDGGQTFEPYMNGLPEGTVVTDLKYNPLQNVVTAGTYGRGAWQIAVDPLSPLLLYDSVELPLVEVDGNGNGMVEPGETWRVRPFLRNGGGQTALGVQARLSTTTPGVTILEPAVRDYGDIEPGQTAGAQPGHEFVVDPSFSCGDPIVFDIVDVTSTETPEGHPDRMSAFTVTVVGDYEPPVITIHLDDDFDPDPAPGWSHGAVDPDIQYCEGLEYQDEWHIRTKDLWHAKSYHCGNGPGGNYRTLDFSWLYYGGRDSAGGAGLLIPEDALEATLTLEHWYDTVAGEDGAQVVIDALQDNQDVYVPLEPEGGYPGGILDDGFCCGLQDKEAFQGSSGDWITSTFDLTEHIGRRIWLAFVFGSDNINNDNAEGWYIDRVKIETLGLGAPLCEIAGWPGSVPPTVTFGRPDAQTIEATWEDSCNLESVPGQTYSIQSGDLDALHSSGSYSHVPVDGTCDRLSSSAFAPGAGNEYYLLVPNSDGREGGAGTDSNGSSRPPAGAGCGELREGDCP
jgi:hypothetical protein